MPLSYCGFVPSFTCHTFRRLEPILAEDGVLTGVTGRNRLGVLFPAEVAGEMLILRYVRW